MPALFEENYEILRELGRGGMSIVYLAMDRHLNKQWAIKVMRKGNPGYQDAVLLHSLRAEADLLKKLDHPSLPRIVDILEDEENIGIVMDYIEGESLDHILRRYGAQPVETVVTWGKQLCEVLNYLHTQQPPIVYRDLKPGNIMVRPQGDIRLIDFGIARAYRMDVNKDTNVLGTQGYASPEQFSTDCQSDIRSDIYSLGATLYHVASGHHPLEHTVQPFMDKAGDPLLSSGLENILNSCMEKDAKRRYQRVAQVWYALTHVVDHADSYRKKQQQHLLLWMSMQLLCIVLLAMGVLFSNLAKNIHATTYEGLLSTASQEKEESQKQQQLHQAIALLPKRYEAYEALLHEYQEDAVFTLQEEADLKQYVQPYLSQAQTTDHYASICFQIGKLYWYYYAYGKEADPPLTRMKAARFWFEEAGKQPTSSFSEIANTYAEIGRFHTEITLRIEEVEDAGWYRKCWKNFVNLLEQRRQEKTPEIVRAEGDRMIAAAILQHGRGFCEDGITEKEQQAMLATLYQEVKQLRPVTEKMKKLRSEILTICEDAQKTLPMVCTSITGKEE